jgi:hypothetical protein
MVKRWDQRARRAKEITVSVKEKTNYLLLDTQQASVGNMPSVRSTSLRTELPSHAERPRDNAGTLRHAS